MRVIAAEISRVATGASTVVLVACCFTGLAGAAATGDASPQISIPSSVPAFSIDATVSTTSDAATLTVKNDSTATSISVGPMLPSSWVGPYTLLVTGHDAANNAASMNVPVWYDPPKAGLVSATSGRVSIPAITTPVKDQYGRDALISETLKRSDGAPVSGSLPVYAAIKPTGTITLKVNGVAVVPGAAPVSVGVYNFAQPVLSLPLSVDQAGVSGESPLILLLGDSKAPVIESTVATWGASVSLTTDKWTVYQGVSDVSIQVTTSGSVPCQVIASTSPNRRTDVCRLEWTSLPEGLAPVTGSLNLRGHLWSAGDQKIAYTLYYFDGRNEVAVAAGERTITATAPLGMFSFNPSRPLTPVTRGVGTVDMTMAQDGGPTCALRATVDSAKVASAGGQLGCYLTWTSLPTGITADARSAVPRLTGSLSDAGQQNASWQAFMVSPGGSTTMIAQGDVAFDTVDPGAPTLTFIPSASVNSGVLSVPVEGGAIGDVSITSDKAVVTWQVLRDGKVLSSDAINATLTGGATYTTRRTVKVDASDIWTDSTVTIKAFYRDLPDITAQATVPITYVAASTIRPVISADSTSELDTDTLPVTVTIRDMAAANAPYSADRMGQWRVRVLLAQPGGQSTALTDFAEALNGEAVFNIPLSDFGGSSIRLDAEAQLITSNPAESRVEKSSRSVSVSVLRGGSIGASVGAERVVGPAPLASVFVVNLVNSKDQIAIDSIDWESSDDGGSTWSTLPAGAAKYKPRLTYRFTAGRHLVRAVIVNRYSKEVSRTDAVEVEAFDVPVVTVTGPSQVLAGGHGAYTAHVTAQDGTVPNYDLQWSLDGGQTWADGSDSLDLTRSEQTRIPLRARARLQSAPPDQDTAWTEARLQVDFLRVRPPTVRISGPTLAETGRQATLTASATLPYANMEGSVQGEWTLPDGTVVSGSQVEWTPTTADELKGSVVFTYHAWIDGFRDAGGETTAAQTVRIWTYKWPDWNVTVNTTYAFAPSDAVIRVDGVGDVQKIDNLSLVWTIPPELTVTDARRGQVRIVNAALGGTYPIEILITDARGNRSLLDTTLTLGDPPPLALSLDLRPGNRYSRAPLDMTVVPRITGGHPRDTPSKFTYFVDGAEIPGAGNSVGRVTLQEGTHSIGVQADMRLGETVTGEQDVTVNPNHPPTCTASVRNGYSGWSYQADCTDTDGRLVKYLWRVDGVDQTLSSDRITVSKRDRTTAPTVSVIGVDDSGAQSPEAVAR